MLLMGEDQDRWQDNWDESETMKNTATAVLISLRDEAKADSIKLVWHNPTESDCLGKLVRLINNELRSRGYGVKS